ncbi:hypothetical protein MN116_001377 [Schistosoma mekongi]|uniref:Post-SET domain-containing protein n=1 Tax=Schistosoma mekongi TaxID=38744 RepID=A0AAE1ZL69_SCHME|nr:hypothetical protein MN116_001377 [Schistosoma mekongi]
MGNITIESAFTNILAYWSVDGEIRIGFFAREDIPSGQEVTIDYQFVQYGVSEQKCYCGTPTCSGVMGATSKYLQEKVRMKDTTMVERRILQLLQLESFRNADDITLLLQVMVQECLTRCTRLELLNRLIKTEHDACLKLFRQYNGLDMLAAFMYDAAPKDWELKKQILVCLKHIPVSEQKQVQSNSHLMEIVAQWTQNPQHCRRRGIFSEPWKCADVHMEGNVDQINKHCFQILQMLVWLDCPLLNSLRNRILILMRRNRVC